MTLINEVRVEKYEARYVGGHMQIKLNFKLTEMSPKKVLLSRIYRRMLTVSSSLRFYQMFWCKLIKRSSISSWFVIFNDAVTDATLICIASHAWPGSFNPLTPEFFSNFLLIMTCTHKKASTNFPLRVKYL